MSPIVLAAVLALAGVRVCTRCRDLYPHTTRGVAVFCGPCGRSWLAGVSRRW